MAAQDDCSQVIIEFVAMGANVKVSAICSRTGVEASIVGSSSAPRQHLEQTAMRKLAYVKKKKSQS